MRTLLEMTPLFTDFRTLINAYLLTLRVRGPGLTAATDSHPGEF